MKKLVCFLLSSTALCSYAADPAQDSAYYYTNPWGPSNPQNRASSGFAPWTFETFEPPTKGPAFEIDVAKPASLAFAIPMAPGYDAAWTSFTGDGQLDSGQYYTTKIIYHAPGHSTSGTPTQGFDLMALSPSVPSHYLNFGHQVLGLYLGQTSSSSKTYSFFLAIHNTLSDEHADQFVTLPIRFSGGMSIALQYSQGSAGTWQLKLDPSTGNAVVLTSSEYGPTWNTTTGIDAVRLFTSQAIENGHPLEWTHMTVK
jgi:hypothetical protein